MNFSESDIIRLYGSRFFLVEEEGTGVREQGAGTPLVGTVRQAVPEEKSEVGTDRQAVLTPITWKMRSTATIALVMGAAEFKNRMMTLALKNAVEAAGVDTSVIGFGVIEGEGSHLDFSGMPVPAAIVFREIADPVAPEGKKVYSMSTVGEIVLNTEKQDTLMSLLKEITTTK